MDSLNTSTRTIAIRQWVATTVTVIIAVVVTILTWRAGSIVYILTGLGALVGITSEKEAKLFSVLFRAAIGGAVGSILGGWIALLIEPPDHWLLGPSIATIVFAWQGGILGISIGFLTCLFNKLRHGAWKDVTTKTIRIDEIITVAVGTALAAVMLRLI